MPRMKTYNGSKNVSGNFIKLAREDKNMTKEELCHKLDLKRCLYQ